MSADAIDLSRESSDVGGLGDRIARYAFFACALVTVATTIAIAAVLINGAIDFFANAEVSLVEYFTSTDWSPRSADDPSFGVLPLVWGTMMITVGSAVIALPVGTLTAIYLSEYADQRVRKTVKPILEILAGIPTIVYGFFALSFITPILQIFFDVGTFNAASAAIVVGVMIIPMVSSLSEDAMSSVPDSLRNGAYGLGATKFEVSTQIVLPASLSGILAAYILAISRAIGETMAVALAAGALSQITTNPFEEIQTMTAFMVEIGTGDASVGSVGYQSLFAIGLTLFLMTFAMNIGSMWIRSRYREEYE